MTPETVQAVLFYAITAVVAGACLMVVFARRIVTCVFALFFTLFGMAGYYAMLRADFLAVTQVVVYVGGILALLLFGILLTSRTPTALGLPTPRNYVLTTLAGAIVFAVLVVVASNVTPAPTGELLELESTVEPLGRELLGRYLFMFEFSSITLLVALVGAAFLVRQHD